MVMVMVMDMARDVDFLQRRAFVLSALILVGSTGACVCIASEEASSLEEQVDRLVLQLNHRELSRREESEKGLIALGPASLPYLPEITPRTPAEIRHRLTRIRRILEQAEAAVRATRLTLQGDSLTLAEIFAAIERQTGNEVFDYRNALGQPAPEQAVRLNIDPKTFWPAIDQFLDAANLSVYHYSGEPKLAVVARTVRTTPRYGSAAYSGPFRVEATGLRAESDTRDARSRTLHVGLELSWEPRLRPVNLILDLAKIVAIDSEGASLAVSGSNSKRQMGVRPGTTGLEIEIPLTLPARRVERIASLQGNILVTVPGRRVVFRFDDLLGKEAVEKKKNSQRQAGAVVSLESVRKKNDLWEFRVRLKYDDSSGALESHHAWVYDNPCRLITAKGEEIDYAAMERYLENRSEVGVAYLFDIEEEPTGYTLEYETAAAISRVPVEFELNDLELP